MSFTVEDLRNAANEEAQLALRAMNDFRARTGRRDRCLEDRYEAAERVVDSLDDLIRLDKMLDRNAKVAHEAAWGESVATGEYAPLALTDDPGDHFVWPV